MNKSLQYIMFVLVCVLLQACSAGDMRAWSDALAEQNGQEVTYPDQQYVDYVGDIKVITGVKNGRGFLKLINTSDSYCRVMATFEDGNKRYFNLNPNQSTHSVATQIYNQVDSVNTSCGNYEGVFNEMFDDE